MLKRLLWTAALAVAATATAARADFVVDDFSKPGTAYFQPLTVTGSTGAFVKTDDLGGGINREATATLITLGELSNSVALGATGSNQRFNLATDSGSTAVANLKYTFTGSAGVDLSAAGTDRQLAFSSADLDIPFSVKITDTAGMSKILTLTAAKTTTLTPYRFSMADFTGVDLSKVSSIELALNQDLLGVNPTISSADFTLRDIRVLTPPPPVDPPAVPAPAGVVLLLAAAPVAGLYRLRRKARAEG